MQEDLILNASRHCKQIDPHLDSRKSRNLENVLIQGYMYKRGETYASKHINSNTQLPENKPYAKTTAKVKKVHTE
jgi:hypothetical protein